jgi:hypothetical protein
MKAAKAGMPQVPEDFSLLAQNPALLAAAIAFNQADAPPALPFAPDVPATWPAALQAEAGDSQPPEGQAPQQCLSGWLAGHPRQWHFLDSPSPAGFWSFTDEAYRLALVPPAEIEQVCSLYGAAAAGEFICGLVDPGRVQQVREKLGEALFGFAVYRGRFLGVEPVKRLSNIEITKEALWAIGRSVFAAIVHPWPAALVAAWEQRWQLKLSALPRYQLDERRRLRALRLFKKFLLTEVAPAWQPCFP